MEIDEPKNKQAEHKELFEQTNKEYQEWMKSMVEKLAPLDPKEVADHNARLEEVKYWREFRGNVFIELLRHYPHESIEELIDKTKYIISTLKTQEL